MTQKVANAEAIRCHILLTNTAREAMTQHIADEHAFFKLQQTFTVHIEKVSVDEKHHITLYFDDKKNTKLQEIFPNRVVIMDCVYDQSGLVAKSFRTRGKGTPVSTNRRAAMKIHFVPSRISDHAYPAIFNQTILALPVAQERYEFVNKRISSWEGYLKVLDKNATIEDIHAKFSNHFYNADFSRMTITCGGLDQKQWKQLKGLAVRMRGFKFELGEVVKVSRGERTVEIELKPDIAKQARKNELRFQSDDVEFTNAATKSQLKRLLKGFDRLKEGLAANANLENILFDEKPTIAKRTQDVALDFHNNLNEFQRDAVTGAMSAEDLYVIQGPPGTGKTTVISEICYQNAKAGLKTLVASQSNLAVDNALSRLLANKDIRILRYGRTESIEEEGKKFIEENVAGYWKEQTYKAIRYEVDHYESKEQQLTKQVAHHKEQLDNLLAQMTKLTEQVRAKKEAEEKLHVLSADLAKKKQQLVTLKREHDDAQQKYDKLLAPLESYQQTMKAFEQQLAAFTDAQTLQQQLVTVKTEGEAVKTELEAAELLVTLSSTKAKLEKVTQEIAHNTRDDGQMAILYSKVDSLKKVFEVEDFMEQYNIRRSYTMDRLLTAMEKLQPNLDQFKPLKDILIRIDKAIAYSQTSLGIYVEPEKLPANHTYTIENVSEFLTELSKAFAQKRVNASNGTRSIQGLHKRKQYLLEQKEKYDDHIREVILIFTKFKEEIKKQLQQQTGDQEAKLATLREQQGKLKGQVTVQSLHFESLKIPQPRTVQLLQQLRMSLDQQQKQYTQQQVERQQVAENLQAKQQDYQLLLEQTTAGEVVLTALSKQLTELGQACEALQQTKVELEQLTAQNPEVALEQNKRKQQTTEEVIAKIEQQIAMIPITEELQTEWLGMLENANEHDLDEIRKLYVKHANVIGTTCVASANKEFMENYPTFDVVIIDEVSKATPPELLLPMLKGAKIILVGDHHQLPPLVGDDTFEETLTQVIKESDTFEEKRELEKLLEESLFERLYKNLPAENKKMLAIQYRMHENIMATIAPFYANENDALQCGLQDSDGMRDHLLTTPQIARTDHLLWVDLPNEKAYFEERMKEGSSLFNQAELQQIKQLLLEVNEATANAKAEGLLAADELKSVGVISFYAEQVKRINRLIEQELHLPHLHIRTGSVDKFQGMEMDLIFVSMVRNHDNPKGEIGFAKDYRRLNVALSRARELLVMIGSSEMFTKRPKKQQTREMYTHLLTTVQAQKGHRQLVGLKN